MRRPAGGWRLSLIGLRARRREPAGRVGLYYRSRNLPLLLRRAFGRSRLAALILSAPTELLALGAVARRGQIGSALRGVIGGWFAGVTMKG